MIEWTWFSLALVLLLLAEFKLEWLATLLNIKAFPRHDADANVTHREPGEAERLDRAREYLSQHSRLGLMERTASLFALLCFWFVGGFSWLDVSLRNSMSSPLWVGLAYVAVLVFAQLLFQLPFQWVDTFRIEQRFGFNRSTQKVFIGDFFRNLALMALLGLPLAAAVLWIFQRVPHAWLWAWLVFTAFQCVLMWLAPTWILPLFNRFSPMPAGDLRDRIQALGKSCGFPLDGVFVMDGSKRSSKANAFFTGFGKRKKIALYDTLIDSCTPDELIGVLAHEIGHFRCGHIRQRLGFALLQSAGMFFLLGWCTDPGSRVARAVFDAFGVAEISPHVGLVLFGIVLGPFARLWGIPLNAWSRRQEFEADTYAVKATGAVEPLVSALQRLHQDQLAHPCPARLRVWLDYSHPPLAERIERMRRSVG